MKVKNCLICNNEFEVEDYLYEKRKFCSLKCVGEYNRRKANENKIKKICPVCKKEYLVPNYLVKKNKYNVCSKECRGIYERNRIKCECYVCKKEVYRTPSQIKKSKSGFVFCSNKCCAIYSGQLRKNRIKKECIICGKEYEVRLSLSKNSVTCSVECQHKWQSKYLVGEKAGNYKGGGGYINCNFCSKRFYVSKYKFENKLTKFCSKKCKQEYWKIYVLHNEQFKLNHLLGNITARSKFPKETKPEKMVREWLESHGFIKNIHFKQEQGFFHKYIVDFWFVGTKIVLEINGDYWHANPSIYGFGDGLIPPNESQLKQIEKDNEKINDFKKHGFSIFVLWEKDIYDNLDKIMNEIINTCNIPPQRLYVGYPNA